MDWILYAFLFVSILHMAEEFLYPGGFMDLVKRLNPRFAPFVTVRFAVIVNGLQLVLCILVLLIGRSNASLCLSVAALFGINALIHIGACFKARGYAPGIITGILLYLPTATYAYASFAASGTLTWTAALTSGALGLLYQVVPLSYLGLARVMSRPGGPAATT